MKLIDEFVLYDVSILHDGSIGMSGRHMLSSNIIGHDSVKVHIESNLLHKLFPTNLPAKHVLSNSQLEGVFKNVRRIHSVYIAWNRRKRNQLRKSKSHFRK